MLVRKAVLAVAVAPFALAPVRRADITLTSSRVPEAASAPAVRSRTTHPPHAARPEGARTLVHSIALPTGVTLQYAEHGSSTGIPVIFLHGVSDSWRSFEHVFPHLPSSIRALAVTARGHGDSSRPVSGYRHTHMAEDLRAFMNAMELPSAVVVGHSMGASVAQRLALDHPSRVAGLVLAGAFASIEGNADVQTFVAESRKMPTLIVWGDRDAYASRIQQDTLRAAIGGARFAVYESAGHALHWEQPRRFAADVTSFVYERR